MRHTTGKMIKSTSYLKRLNPIIKKLSAEYQVPEESIEFMFDEFLTDLKDMIQDPRMPKIQITNWGTYKPSIGKINWQIRRAFYDFRNGSITREALQKKVSMLWPVKQRLIKEQKGESTWIEWRNKELIPYAETKNQKEDETQLPLQ